MAWYGSWRTAIVALVCAALIRDTVVTSVLRKCLWLFPLGAMLVGVYLMRIFSDSGSLDEVRCWIGGAHDDS